MLILKLLSLFLSVALVLILLLPRGNPVFELLNLPMWLLKLYRLPFGNYIMSKIRYGKSRHQYFLYLKPISTDIEKESVIVYIHGGGWQFGNPYMFKANAQFFVNEGYDVVLLTHRRLPFHDITDMRADISFSFRTISQYLQENGRSGKRILLGGMSSGGNLAALCFFDSRILESVGLDASIFSGLFMLGAPLNLREMRQYPPIFLLSGGKNSERFSLADPSFYLSSSNPVPVLIVHSEKDGLVPINSVISYTSKLKQAYPAEVEFHILKNGIHTDAASMGFPGHPIQKILLNWILRIDNEVLTNKQDHQKGAN